MTWNSVFKWPGGTAPTLTGGTPPTWSTSPGGKPALYFNSANANAQLGSPLVLSGNYTICAFVTQIALNGINSICGGEGPVYSKIFSNSSGNFLLYTSYNEDTTTAAAAAGVEQHIAFTVNGSVTSAYVNGALDNNTGYHSGNNFDLLDIGYFIFQSGTSNMKLRDVRPYSRALSGTEIASIAAGTG